MNIIESSSSSSESDDDDVWLVRRQKKYNTRKNYHQIYDELDFFQRFRITKNTFFTLLGAIEDDIAPATNRGGSIKPVIQLLLTLRFYACGSMQRTVADFTGVSTSSACRIIRRVSASIASLRPRYIKMYENNEEMEQSAEKFYQIARFPRVIGAIDCTLIKIQSPGGEDAEIYRTRKNFFGINVQTVSDSEAGRFKNFLLVGDSGYQLKPYLMTKLQTVRTHAENLYNESIIRTRNVVERQYGVLKRRFPVLQLGMRLKIETVLNVIVATAVLHNIALEENEEIPDDWLENIDEDEDLENEDVFEENENAANVRRILITEHFARL